MRDALSKILPPPASMYCHKYNTLSKLQSIGDSSQLEGSEPEGVPAVPPYIETVHFSYDVVHSTGEWCVEQSFWEAVAASW